MQAKRIQVRAALLTVSRRIAARVSGTVRAHRSEEPGAHLFGQVPSRRASALVALGLWLVLTAFMPQAFGASLATEISEVVERPTPRRAFWGIQIVDLGSGQTVYERNAEKLFIPASNAKLFSTALGLVHLGPDYHYTTYVVSSVSVAEGVVAGDLALMGGGDPNLSARVLPYDPDKAFEKNPLLPITELAQQVVDAGVRRVAGDIIGDDTRYVWQRYPEGWSTEDTSWGYGAPISALTFNDNLIDIRILPGRAAGLPARLTIRPGIPYYSIENRIRTAPTRTVARGLTLHREPGSRTLALWGQISIRSRGRTFSAAVNDPPLFAALALRSELERLGVTVEGEVRSRHALPYEFASLKRASPRKAADPESRLAAIQSVQLADGLLVINKESQNLHAEMLLREVGFVRRGVGSFEAGLEELEEFLQEAGLKPREFQFSDGSGLSRKNLVSPQATVDLLTYMWKSPHRESYLQALPLAGEDGTLDWRFSKSPAKGRIRAKTGTLAHVTALSGYATTLDGRDLAFSILVNNFGVSASYIRNLVDKICVAMVTAEPADATELSTGGSGASIGGGAAATHQSR